MSLQEVKTMAQEWMEDYNHNRSHSALEKLTPIEYLERYNQTTEMSSLELCGISGS